MYKVINELRKFRTSDKVTNQYRNNVLCSNLEIYLENMKRLEPKVIFIGEAAGYKGCKLTGIPFTSEDIMMTRNYFDLFGNSKGYNVISNSEKFNKEISATIVWNAYVENEICPLMWNAFPFHPHKIGNEQSNRTPNRNEIDTGLRFLRLLLDDFPSVKYFIAVGNNADKYLSLLNKDYMKIRHPSMGGKEAFISGLKEMKKKLKLI